MRNSVQKLAQVSIKIFKISYFYFTFKLNERKKVLFKKYDLERRDYKKILLEEGFIFNRKVRNGPKSGA